VKETGEKRWAEKHWGEKHRCPAPHAAPGISFTLNQPLFDPHSNGTRAD
jgi:hypothetical protein